MDTPPAPQAKPLNLQSLVEKINQYGEQRDKKGRVALTLDERLYLLEVVSDTLNSASPEATVSKQQLARMVAACRAQEQSLLTFSGEDIPMAARINIARRASWFLSSLIVVRQWMTEQELETEIAKLEIKADSPRLSEAEEPLPRVMGHRTVLEEASSQLRPKRADHEVFGMGATPVMSYQRYRTESLLSGKPALTPPPTNKTTHADGATKEPEKKDASVTPEKARREPSKKSAPTTPATPRAPRPRKESRPANGAVSELSPGQLRAHFSAVWIGLENSCIKFLPKNAPWPLLTSKQPFDILMLPKEEFEAYMISMRHHVQGTSIKKIIKIFTGKLENLEAYYDAYHRAVKRNSALSDAFALPETQPAKEEIPDTRITDKGDATHLVRENKLKPEKGEGRG